VICKEDANEGIVTTTRLFFDLVPAHLIS